MGVQSEINEFLTFLSLTPVQNARDANASKKYPQWAGIHSIALQGPHNLSSRQM